MTLTVYLGDGFVESPNEARVSIFDRGYLFGDSIFETLRTYDGHVFALDAHLDRLEHASAVTGIVPKQHRAAIAELVRVAIERSGFASAYVRVTVSRGEGGAGLGTQGCNHPVLSIIVKEHVGYPAEAYEKGIESIVLKTRKVPAECLDPAMKTGNYLPNVMAKRELERARLIEGVMLSTTGVVVSGTVSNVFLVRGRQLRTPNEASGCRPGVTREIILELGSRLGLEVVSDTIQLDDLHTADEIFFVNTLMECLPVRKMFDHELRSAEPTSWTRKMQGAYREAVLT